MEHDQHRRPDWKGSLEWLHFAARLPAAYQPLPTGSGGGLVEGGRAILMGGFAVNNSTAAGNVIIFDGTDSSGIAIARMTLAASSSATLNVGTNGILLERGAFITTTVSVNSGCLYLIPLWRYTDTQPGR